MILWLLSAARMARAYLNRHWFALAGVLILCGISFGAGWWVNESSASPGEKLVRAAYQDISQQSILSPADETELAYAAVRGMIGVIDDPYAELIEPQAAGNFSATFAGDTGVVGLYIRGEEGRAVAEIVFPQGAAEAAGVQVGDELVSIDGVALDRQVDSSEVGLMLRGTPGSTVHIVTRRGEQVIEYDLKRRAQQFVSSRMLPGGVGYVALYAYNRAAAGQMKQALESLLAQHPRALIWDLRSNEGGDMQAAQDILSLFIKEGPLFTAELTYGRTVPFNAKGGAIAADLPLAVVIDHTTYSAAETSAAVIAETGRGTTVGTTTYGKGVIQATIPLPEDAMLQMTVAKWLSPTGQWLHHKGVTPLVSAPDNPATTDDESLAKALEIVTRQTP